MATTSGQPQSNAFDEIAPSTCSSRIKQLPYDVFINHRGIDVKYTLATAIYHALDGTGLRVFLDVEELELGDFLPAALQQAMAGASLHIAILSQHYAESPWCLAELAFMLQTGTTIIPVFYQVQPYDVRRAVHGKGIYVDAFAEYERKGRYSLQKLQEWKMALHKVSFYSGDTINNEDDERRVLKKIVNRVMKEMKKVPLEVAKHPVGLNDAVEEFGMTARQSAASTHHNVQIVGIWGMGGSGKTTLAKELYNKNCWAMERSSFLFDLRDAAGKGLLLEKQKKLLEDLGFNGPSTYDHVEQGKGILASRLRSVSVLIVLDDVDHLDQLDALLPGKESFGRGRLIIVTTCELDVLTSWAICHVYKMKPLKPFHAKQLFCWHAFLQPSPLSGFEILVEEFSTACNGLPLSLKVLGGQLYGKSDRDYWVSQLDKISRILPNDIKEKLKVSYDALDEEEKEMFLDIACFFIGEKKSVAIAVWDGSGWNGLQGWEKLVNKCLVELAEPGDKDRVRTDVLYKPLVLAVEEGEEHWIRMHDQLRDLGREIANRQSPFRLWFPRQIIHTQLAEEIWIRGIKSGPLDSDDFPRCSSQGEIIVNTSKGFHSLKPHMLGLKIFVGSGRFLNQDAGEKSRELVWLRCSILEQKHLPSWLSLENLRILELYWATRLEELWENAADAPLMLKELVIDYCTMFKGFPRSIGRLKHLKDIRVDANYGRGEGSTMRSLPQDFCRLQSLEHLQLRNCSDLSSLPSRFGDLTNLRHLDLSSSNLPSLPRGFGNLKNLRHLNLSVCRNLSSLCSRFSDLTVLRYLNLSWCRKLTLKSQDLDILENMTELQYLNLSHCQGVDELPRHIANRISLKEVYLDGTSIREVPGNIGHLSKLEILSVGSPLLTSFPASLGNLSSLTTLEINSEVLTSLPTSLGNLSSLHTLEICFKLLTSMPTSIGNLSSLRKLKVSQSGKLESLPDSIGRLTPLEDLSILWSAVKTLPESFAQLINLQSLHIDHSPISVLSFGPGCKVEWIHLGSTQLSKVSMSEDCCPCLRTLHLQSNDHLTEIETLPTTVSTIELISCKMLKDIRNIGSLVNLQRLEIRDCPDIDALPCFAELTSLKDLYLKYCSKVEKIEGLEHLRSLEKLIINGCTVLHSLPSLAELIFLKEFELEGPHNVQKIEGLEYLRSLEKLMISGCPKLDVLNVAEFTSLKFFESKDCPKVNIEGLEDLTSLEKLIISGCPELDGLPSFAEFTSLKFFELKECHKVEKIQGLEHLRLLEVFKAYSCLKVPCTVTLKHTDRLRELVLVGNERSVVERCIRTIQKWPGEVIICIRAVCDLESPVDCIASPNLSLIDFFAMAKIGSYGELKLRHKQPSSITNAIMICLIINVVSPVIDLGIRPSPFNPGFEMELDRGKWLWIGLFTQGSNWRYANAYEIFQKASENDNVVVAAWLVTGEEGRPLEAFHHVFNIFSM